MVATPSARTGAEEKVVIRYADMDLLEVQSVSYDIDRKGRVGGAGIGHPRNTYHKFGVPEGTFSIEKSELNAAPQATLFATLIAGTTAIQTETFSSGDPSITLDFQATGVVSVWLTGTGYEGTLLVEGDSYTINYSTLVVTLVGGALADGSISYTSNDSTLLNTDPLDGANYPMMFDIEIYERASDTLLQRLVGCAPYTVGKKSGGIGEDPFTENLEGNFLQYVPGP